MLQKLITVTVETLNMVDLQMSDNFNILAEMADPPASGYLYFDSRSIYLPKRPVTSHSNTFYSST